MKDRQPTRPGRVKITPESGEAFYAVMEMADEPTEVGTPPTKANLLKDTTAALFGGDENMVPDDALVALKTLIDDLTPQKVGAAQIVYGTVQGTGTSKVVVNSPFYPQLILVSGLYIRDYDSSEHYYTVVSGPNSGFGQTFYDFEANDYISPVKTTVTESDGVYSITLQCYNFSFYNHPFNYIVIG